MRYVPPFVETETECALPSPSALSDTIVNVLRFPSFVLAVLGLLCGFLSPTLSPAQSPILFADEPSVITSQNWINTTMTWEDQSRILFEYNAGGAIERSESEFPQNGTWTKGSLTENTYDSNGNLTEGLNYRRDGNTWVENSRTRNVYAGGELVESAFEAWDGTAWQPFSREVYTYESGRLTETVAYFGTGPDPSSRTRFTYDGASDRVTMEIGESWFQGAWRIGSRRIYTYRPDNLLESETVEFLNLMTGVWVPNLRTLSTEYTSDGLLETEIEQFWNGSVGDWENRSRVSNTYAGSRLAETVTSDWTGSNWEESFRTLYIVSGSLLTEIRNEDWQNGWVNVSRQLLGYGVIPVELASFTATRTAGSVQLDWITASETNNAGFDVERRIGETGAFAGLGFVTGRGTTSDAQVYRFSDTRLTDVYGVLNYRLKQVDFDGTAAYSSVLRVDLGLPERLAFTNLGANPVSVPTRLEYTLPSETNVTLHLFNILGQQVAELVNEKQSAGRQSVSLNPGSLTSGIYFLKLTAGTTTLTERVSVIR